MRAHRAKSHAYRASTKGRARRAATVIDFEAVDVEHAVIGLRGHLDREPAPVMTAIADRDLERLHPARCDRHIF